MLEIEYPAMSDIEKCKGVILRAVLIPGRFHRPGVKTVFHKCGAATFVSFLLYALLWLFCIDLKNLPPFEAGIAVLGIYPLTFFAFSFLSVFSEEQCQIIELKTVMKYPCFYVVALRMLYISIAAIFLNLGLVVAVFREWNNVWNLCAAGTAFTLILAMIAMLSYQRYGKSVVIIIPPALWTTLCILLMRPATGQVFYHLLIELVPAAIHIAVSAVSLGITFIYIGKVEVRYAYS